MRDWRGFEGIFHRGDLPVEDLLELTEPHFRFRPTPAPEMRFFSRIQDMETVNKSFHEIYPYPDSFLNLRGSRMDPMRELDRQMFGKGAGAITGIKE